jgi:hypothetical protein
MSTLNTNALCTRKNVKDYLNITGSNSTSDNLINDLINRISTAFESYCGRSFLSATYTEYYDGRGENELFLDKYPVTSITEINDDSDWTWATSTVIPSASYRIADERSVYYDGIFSTGRQSIKITYVAGYSTTPEDLLQAAIEEVGRKFKHQLDYDEAAKTLGDGSVTFQDSNFLPQTIKTLSYYKIKVVY